MSRGQTAKLYRTFAKGLITEAGFLTYPEDASSDELNTVIHRKGNRSRRFGIDYEPDSTASTLTGYDSDEIVTEYVWQAAANRSTIHFLCVQVGDIIHFYTATANPIISGQKSFTVDLNTFGSPSSTPTLIRTNRVEMASGKGFLFIAHPYCNPIVAEYDPDADTLTAVPIVIQVRDFDGVDDGLANDEEPTTLTPEHHYNLRNQGWSEPGSMPDPATVGTGGGYVDSPDQTSYDPYSGGTHTYPRNFGDTP